MKWFKLDSDFMNDEKIDLVFQKSRTSAAARDKIFIWIYFMSICGKMYEGDPEKEIKIPICSVLRQLRIKRSWLHSVVTDVQQMFSCRIVEHDGYLKISYPKFLEKQKKYKVTAERKGFVPLGRDKKKEEDKDKKYIKKAERPTSKSEISPDVIFELWNKMADQAKLPKVEKLTDIRKKKIYLALKAIKKLDDWKTVLIQVPENDFRVGENDRGWTANFDWLFRNENYLKMLEEANHENKNSLSF